MDSGIYMLKCKFSNLIYIGKSKALSCRKYKHKYDFKKGKNNRILQELYDIYGWESFDFTILKKCDIDKLEELEKVYINKYKDICVNLMKPDKYGNFKHNSYTIKIQSEVKKGRNNPMFGRSGKNNPMFGKRGKDNPLYGLPNIRRNLSIEQCFEIKNLLIKKEDVSKIAIKFNVSKSTIKNIKNGTHWSSNELNGSYKDWIEEI